ncbi:Bug family tripartite tricarboxylate transporter substrate binding protein [Cupriavidus alkaliphilus]|uniref:Bug family tripartite tricarboxylate transporter substrate binding protein n=1 Tax=Cupriavidus alkaliphilus TaxID=942866 RepID=UPI0017B8013A|nr:tripartite tricarboxylate transporter substrate binding protein [Cupriavidus alkaliphilus]MBB3014047.1 tripartite-type tricarboxylate transporter receptor subunit TctC [Cupriavidus alkaliphilus]
MLISMGEAMQSDVKKGGWTFGRAMRWLPAITVASSGLAQGQAWPTKPVRLVVPVSAGGATDQLARIVSQALAQNLGQPFVVDVKPGAAGAIASVEVARAPADGYTLLVATSSTHAVAPALSTKLRYNAVDDFTPIGLLAQATNLLIMSPTVPVKDLKALLALAREKPGALNYVSAGPGSFAHLSFEYFMAKSGVALTHVPYKGVSSALPDMVAGSVHLGMESIATALPHVKEGRLIGLAVTGPRRSPLAPDIPTVAEAGVPGFSVVSWFGLYAPRGLTPELTLRINEEVNKALRSPEMASRFANLGIESGSGSPAAFASMVADDTAQWRRLGKESKIKLN